MQNRVEDVLQRSGMMVVFDEAHFFFDLRPRMYARPELVDWIDTALCNNGVPWVSSAPRNCFRASARPESKRAGITASFAAA